MGSLLETQNELEYSKGSGPWVLSLLNPAFPNQLWPQDFAPLGDTCELLTSIMQNILEALC